MVFKTRLILLVLLSLFCLPMSFSATVCFQNYNLFGPVYGLNLEARMLGFTNYVLKWDKSIWNQLSQIKMSERCQVLIFQEVWTESHFQKLKNNLEISYDLYHFDRDFRKVKGGGFKYGLAMAIAKAPIFSSYKNSYQVIAAQPFHENYRGFFDAIREFLEVDKGFSLSKVDIQGKKFYVANTHLHPTSVEVRTSQISQLKEFLSKKEYGDLPILLAGDFNTGPNGEELKPFSKDPSYVYLEKVHSGVSPVCTYCKENPYALTLGFRDIDHIFLRPVEKVKSQVLKTVVYPKTGKSGMHFSDHYGVRTIIEF